MSLISLSCANYVHLKNQIKQVKQIEQRHQESQLVEGKPLGYLDSWSDRGVHLRDPFVPSKMEVLN